MTDTLTDMIRHGEPEGGRAYRGNRIDDPLSEKGWHQMWSAVGDQAPWQRIITSPLLRCSAFAQVLGERYGLPVTVEPRFREIGFGSWEGRTPQHLQENNPEEFDAFYRDPINNRPEGAEPIEDFVLRVSDAYNEVVNACAGQHCLIVSHAGVMRAIIAHVIHAESRGLYRIKIDNAGITRIRHGQFGGMLEFHNGKLPESD